MAPEKAKKAPAAKKKPAAAKKPARSRKAKPPTTVAKPSTSDSGALPVVNAENKQVSEVVLSPAVFGAKANPHLIYEAVKQYRAGARRGTHMTKNRALVSGSGKKPWRQKGTGRARVGEIRTPLWRHGGTVFGPVPRDYSYPMPKKARAAALRSALSQRASEGVLKVVQSLPVQMPDKPPYRLTHQLRAILDKLEVSGKALIVEFEPTDALVLSGRNLPGVRVLDPSHVTVYDVLDCQHVLLTSEGLTKLEERLA
jgi:large subunit ribosomal protein L4